MLIGVLSALRCPNWGYRSKELAPTPVFAKLGSRTPDEQARFRKLIETRGTNVVSRTRTPAMFFVFLKMSDTHDALEG